MKSFTLKPATHKIQSCTRCMGEFDTADLCPAPEECTHYDAVCEYCYDHLVMNLVRLGDY